jgi:cytidylate kinase
MIITIDGPAGSGKSTAARELARALRIACLDTGATYRAAALKALRAGVDLEDEAAVAACARSADIRLAPRDEAVGVLLDGADVTAEIRTPEVSEGASRIARCAAVREVLVDLQRKIGRQLGDFVSEGRDQGSIVFPGADVKFYLDAAPEVRARRRCAELAAAGRRGSYEDILQAIRRRDRRDSTRRVGPLVKPDGAVAVDTSNMSIPQMSAELLRHVEARL